MANLTFTDARIGTLVPRKTAYDIRDGKLRGFGVRVTPSDRKRFCVHCQHRGRRVWKIVGEFDAIGVDEARSRACVRDAARDQKGRDRTGPGSTNNAGIAVKFGQHLHVGTRPWRRSFFGTGRASPLQCGEWPTY